MIGYAHWGVSSDNLEAPPKLLGAMIITLSCLSGQEMQNYGKVAEDCERSPLTQSH